ncbi:MAG: hypothetical protein KIT17_13360 [Rubrivivax sp.]|nr:hypothetical protein [Rubrivivax sp.]
MTLNLVALGSAAAAAGMPALAVAQAAPAAPPAHPLAPIAHWVGGEWVGQFELPGGRRLTLVRTYEWSFDQRLLVGRSFGEVDGRRRQSRETHFFWNPAAQRIEFHDFLDQGGGYGAGVVEVRDGAILMNAKIVGNAGHPDWRARITENGDDQVIDVEAVKDGQWGPFGKYAYKRRR